MRFHALRTVRLHALVASACAVALLTACGARQATPVAAASHGTPGTAATPGAPGTAALPGDASAQPSAAASSRSAAATPGGTPAATHAAVPAVLATGVLFDDFVYTGAGDARFGKLWSVRTGQGAPGQSGATWSPSGVSFDGIGMTLIASTDGTAAGTRHAEVDTRTAKYFTGTYATRIRFTDAPTGPTGAHVNETFFTISPTDDDPLYSEMDFEYLPAGGWGDNRTQLDFTTWHSATDSKATERAAGYDGWHTLVLQATTTSATYYVDGVEAFTTTGAYVPRRTMSICFNTWFIDGELGSAGATRGYRQQTDWVYFAANRTLTPDAVQSQVTAERAAGVTATDTV